MRVSERGRGRERERLLAECGSQDGNEPRLSPL